MPTKVCKGLCVEYPLLGSKNCVHTGKTWCQSQSSGDRPWGVTGSAINEHTKHKAREICPSLWPACTCPFTSLFAGLEWSVPLFEFTCKCAEGTHLQCCLLKSGSNFRPIYYSDEMNLQNIWPKECSPKWPAQFRFDLWLLFTFPFMWESMIVLYTE